MTNGCIDAAAVGHNGGRRAGSLDDIGDGTEEVLAFQDQVVLESKKQLREGAMRARQSDSAESLAYVLMTSLLFVTWGAMATAKFWLGVGILCAGILVLATVSI